MQMNFILGTLMLSLFLVACNNASPLSSNDNADFEQKQKCQQYLSQIKSETAARDAEYNSPEFRNGSRTTIIGKAFFSPKRNSCLYTYTEVTSYLDRDLNPIAPDVTRFALFDILSNEEVMHTLSTKGDVDYWEAQSKFDAQLKEYE